MSQSSLVQFGACRKARELFDLVIRDMEARKKDPRCYRLMGQQIASADSICANIEEGFGRLSRIEDVRFLGIARGSSPETRGRCERLRHWLSSIDEIIGILTSSIIRMRKAGRG